MEELTLGQIVQALTFIAGGIGALTAILKVSAKAWRKFFTSEFKKALEPLSEAQAGLKTDLADLRSDLARNSLQTARIDLLQAIVHTPTEHEAIFELAENYFLKLGGNTNMLGKFKNWAEQEEVDIEYILKKISEHQSFRKIAEKQIEPSG